MQWVAIIVTITNCFIILGLFMSYILYKLEKHKKQDFYESIAIITPIVIMELILIIIPFVVVK